MKAFQEYHDLIIQFHRALSHRDSATLHRILTEETAVKLDRSVPDQHPPLPLSEDIDVQGISIEGNGALTAVTYTNTVELTGERLTLKIYIGEVDGQLRIAQPFPIVAH